MSTNTNYLFETHEKNITKPPLYVKEKKSVFENLKQILKSRDYLAAHAETSDRQKNADSISKVLLKQLDALC